MVLSVETGAAILSASRDVTQFSESNTPATAVATEEYILFSILLLRLQPLPLSTGTASKRRSWICIGVWTQG